MLIVFKYMYVCKILGSTYTGYSVHYITVYIRGEPGYGLSLLLQVTGSESDLRRQRLCR